MELTWKDAHLEFAYLGDARLQEADLDGSCAMDTDFTGAQLQDAYCANVCLQGAYFWNAHAERAEFWRAEFQGAWFLGAHLEGADLHRGRLCGGESLPSHILEAMRQWDEDISPTLPPADLSGVFFDAATNLRDISLGDEEYGYARLVDVHWGDANLAVVDWVCTRRAYIHLGRRIDAIKLGDERKANETKYSDGDPKNTPEDLKPVRMPFVRNHELATALRNQGLNEDADAIRIQSAEVAARSVAASRATWLSFRFVAARSCRGVRLQADAYACRLYARPH